MIPTAEELIKDQIGVSISSSRLTPMDKGECIICMIEFANMHVKQALREASESVDCELTYFYSSERNAFDKVKESILKAYNLENIK